MKRSELVLIFLISAVVITIVGIIQKSAGYMDAEYYAVTGKALMEGRGLTQNFLWNYLDNPVGLPHPSNSYWMPVASILSAINFSFHQGSQKTTLWLVQILFSALIPVITAWTALTFTSRRSDGWMAGMLGLFSGFYLLYYAVPETFSAEMVFGALLIALLTRQLNGEGKSKNEMIRWAGIGILAGLLYMTRAEGLIWLLISLGCLIFMAWQTHKIKNNVAALLLVILGYTLVSGAWFGRNVVLWGQLIPTGTSRTLWLTDYNQMFLHSPESLTFQNWLNQGLISILNVRLDALWVNIKSAIAVQGGILLVPFILAGWWLKKQDKRLILAGIYYGIIIILMTVVFPFAGARGGFIHAAAGIQVFLWAVVPVGLDRFVTWGQEKRNWQHEQARRVFQIGITAIMVILTCVILYQRVIATSDGVSNWLVDETKYQNVYKELSSTGEFNQKTVVMVKNPPGWNLVTGSPAIVIPDGGQEAINAAATKFDVKYLIIDKDHPEGLNLFYSGAEAPLTLELVFTLGDVKVFRFTTTQ